VALGCRQLRVRGWRQPVESDNIAFLLMPHRRPDTRIEAGVATFLPWFQPQLRIVIIEPRIINLPEISANPQTWKTVLHLETSVPLHSKVMKQKRPKRHNKQYYSLQLILISTFELLIDIHEETLLESELAFNSLLCIFNNFIIYNLQ